MRRILTVSAMAVACVAVVATAVYLPLRTEWEEYRKAVPAEQVRTARPGQPVEFGRIRWTLRSYGAAAMKPGDLPPSGIDPPLRPGEVLVTATLEATSLATAKEVPELDVGYELRDRAGNRWRADLWHSLILAGQTNRITVMGTVPGWAAHDFHLVLRRKPRDFTPPVGGPMLVFGR
ncbi:hypothetical protein ACRYCC_04070 [Actinomadura scrupuli]|uniref:hypothetical protein n=1 Tax=Actinomadura scrupuli TaxID=559629 RepID=UPI003D993FAF